MKIFDTTTALAASKLTAGQIVQTKGYSAVGDGGQATYLIKTAAGYGGTPDESTDFTLANGNVAELQIVSSLTVDGNITVSGTVDGRDIAADGAVLDTALQNLVEDTTPQLGGGLDLNGSDITGTGNIDNVGTITTDGLTVSGSTYLVNTAGANEVLLRGGNGGGSFGASKIVAEMNSVGNTFGNIIFKTENAGAYKDRLKIGSYGDVLLYDLAGTTAKFRWDSTNERLGILETNPIQPLHVGGSGNIYVNGGGTFYSGGDLFIRGGTGGKLRLGSNNNNDYVQIDTSANLLVGTTTSPSDTNAVVAVGGVYLKGTTAANHLDDYEEGDYDATLTPQGGGTITLLSATNRLSYVKIGSLVNVQGLLEVSSVSTPSGTSVRFNLPFTPADLTDFAGRSTGSVVIGGTATYAALPSYSEEGSAICYIIMDAATVAANNQFYINLSYRAA